MDIIMDYEKEYKEALERARDVYTYYCDDREQLRKIESIFPVLKESEDERIKREIIEYVKTGTYRNDWVAWLEKQEQVKDSANFQHENKMCKENGDSLTNEDEMVRKELLAVVGDLVLPDDQQSRFVTWLEKQEQVKDSANFQHENKMCKENGDSLTNEDEKVRKALIEYFNEQCDMSDWNGVYGYQVVAWLEKQGKISPILSNSSNIGKVEPKFKVGDWVVEHATNRPVQIVRYEERSDGTLVWFNNGTGIYVDFLCGYHLWTTQDAKDGDVLALNNEVFIYAHRKQMYPVAVAHCYVDSAGGFYHGGEFSYIEKGNSISPATKEQRDLLEKAMTDMGYTFDSEKKELKEIAAPKSEADDEEDDKETAPKSENWKLTLARRRL